MTLAKSSGIFGVKDAEIIKMLSDVEGQAPTFATAVAVPGITALKMSKNVKETESKGDETILDNDETFQYLDVSWDHAEISMEAVAVIGGTQNVVNTPGSPETNSIIESSNDMSNYFQLRCKGKRGSNVSGVGVQIFKCRGTHTYDLVGEGYASSSFKGKAIACKGTIEGVKKPYRKLTFSSGEVTFGAGAVKQVNTAIVAGGPITTAGNATFTVTGSGITGSPLAVSVPVALTDTAAVVALKAQQVMAVTAAITAQYVPTVNGANLIFTAVAAAANDPTLNVSIANGTCAGLTAAPTSTKTTDGQLPS